MIGPGKTLYLYPAGQGAGKVNFCCVQLNGGEVVLDGIGWTLDCFISSS